MKQALRFIRFIHKRYNHIIAIMFVLSIVWAGVVQAQGVGGQTIQQYLGNTRIPKVLRDARAAALAQCVNGSISRNNWLGGFRALCSDGTELRGGAGEEFQQLIADAIFIPPGSFSTITSSGETVTLTYGGGVVTEINNLTAHMLGKPQISSMYYVADVINTIKNPLGAQPAYAQGLGFSALRPVLDLWKIFRNIAYFFFVVIFLIIGFMIMFRSKIGGKAAVTVQQALPQIIVSLLLVTFSYAIAGLMIDLMYLVIYLIIGVFTPYFPGGIAGGSAFGPVSLSDIAFKNNFVQNSFGFLTNGVVGNIAGAMGNIATGALGLQEQDVGGTIIQGFGNITFTLILGIVVLVQIFRVFIALLQAYFNIFISVIFAPIQLLIGALPGQNTFSTWLKGLIENLLVFPVIITMIFIAYFFSVGPYGVQNTNGGAGTNLGFSAPQLTSNQSADGYNVYRGLIALAALLAMPEVLKVTKGIMKGELGVAPGDLAKNFKAGVPLGTRLAFGGVPALVGGALRGANTYRKTLDPAQARNAFISGSQNRFAKAGVFAGSYLSRSIGTNQPDYLNPITNRMDKFADPEEEKRQQRLQLFEAFLESHNGGAGHGGGGSHK